MASNNSVKILEVFRVTPLRSSQASATPSSLPLTFFDILWLRFPPVERVFFYETSSTNTSFMDSILPKLKHSLSLTLHHFLPLTGTFIWPQDSLKPIINYTDNDSVSLTVAESNANFYHLSGNNFVEAVEYHPLVPDLATSHEQAPVLALQVTAFSKWGFCIGITTHHAFLDGKSSTMFMKAWAHLCKLGGNALPLVPELTPCFDRMVIKDPAGLESIYLNGWLNQDGAHNKSLKVWELKTPPGVVRGAFELTRTKLEKLRQLITNILEENNEQEQPVPLSRLILTFSYTWVCLAKVEGQRDNKTHLVINVDARSRLEPPVPGNYFGNCLTGCVAIAERNDLLGEKGVAMAAKAIIEAIRSLDYGVLKGAEKLLSLLLTVKEDNISDRVFGIAGSPRFELYNTDFGWGKPTKVEMISIDKTGAIRVSETRDGAGGIEIGVVLNKNVMEEFASVFAKGLEIL
ncbi:hypothetical protein RGQ29_011463 [Quercus rubra]|uniref:Phenolic glucoside malonyltransferase 1-like n=1 Tax=Quercus rubra TaxID=3512 RepID=A0AAN7G581_QUERU|nr:hypothetical protein RGQ29_011463 [Quercus rubra]